MTICTAVWRQHNFIELGTSIRRQIGGEIPFSVILSWYIGEFLAGIPLAVHADTQDTPIMTVKTAALLAFTGTILVTALLVWNLIFTVMNTVRGLVPAITLVPAVIYAFAAAGVAMFFWSFRRS